MPIDRVFTVEGRGCVAAGSPWSGVLQIGDQLQIARTGQLVRVREIEVHGIHEQRSQIGVRTALNLTGVSASEIARGDELVATDTHVPASRLLVELKTFVDATEVKCPTTIQFHTATSATSAAIRPEDNTGVWKESSSWMLNSPLLPRMAVVCSENRIQWVRLLAVVFLEQ